MDEIDILPKRKGWVVHDGYSSYEQYPEAQHALYNAHHQRDIEGQYEQAWADKMSALSTGRLSCMWYCPTKCWTLSLSRSL